MPRVKRINTVRQSRRLLEKQRNKGNQTAARILRYLNKEDSRRMNEQAVQLSNKLEKIKNKIKQNLTGNTDGISKAITQFQKDDSWLKFTPEEFTIQIRQILQQAGVTPDINTVNRATGALFCKVCLAKLQNIIDFGLERGRGKARKIFKKKMKTVIKNLKNHTDDIKKAFSNFEQTRIIDNNEVFNSTISQYTKWIGTIFQYTPDNFRAKWLNRVKDKSQCAKILRDRYANQMPEEKITEKAAVNKYFNEENCYICKGRFRTDNRTPECEHILPIFLALRHLWIVREGLDEYTRQQLELLNLEYEFSHRCCNQCKSDLSLIYFQLNANRRMNFCQLDQDNINKVFEKILIYSTRGSWACDSIQQQFLFNDTKIQEAKVNLGQRLASIVTTINNVISNPNIGFNGEVVNYLAWTKLKALSCLSNVELFELFTEESLSEAIVDAIPQELLGGSKSDNLDENNKLLLMMENILNEPAITQKEIVFNTLLNFGCNIQGYQFEPVQINYNGKGSSTIKMVLNGRQIVQTVESLDAVKDDFLKPIDFSMYRSEEFPDVPSIYEDIDTENGNSTLQLFFNDLMNVININNTSQIIPSVQSLETNNITELTRKYMSQGMTLENAINETAKTIKNIKSMGKSMGMDISIQQSASIALNQNISSLIPLKTGRQLTNLSMIPEESYLPSVISVRGGKKRKKKLKKKKKTKKFKRKKKKKRTRRKKK